MLRSPLNLTPRRLVSPMSGVRRFDSPMQDVPPGDAELDWGLPLTSDIVSTIHIRMNPNFSIPADGVLPTTEIDLLPQVSPPTGEFPVQVSDSTELVELEEVLFV